MARRLEVVVWAAALAAAGVAGALADTAQSLDTPYFLDASRTLFSAHGLTTFADPGLQAGPLEVGGIGAAARLGSALGVSPLRGVAVVQDVLLMALVLLAARVICRGRRRTAVLAATAAVALATGTIGGAFFYGHPAQIVDPVLWILAAAAAQRGRTLAAGALVGASAGLETWGILGLPVLILALDRRTVVRGAVAALGVVAALYGPFAIHGPFGMFHYRWDVVPGTLPATLGLHSFTWGMRLVQAAAAGGSGVAAALLARRAGAARWLVPLCIVWVRIALDPVFAGWYLLAPQTIAVLAAAQTAASPWRSLRDSLRSVRPVAPRGSRPRARSLRSFRPARPEAALDAHSPGLFRSDAIPQDVLCALQEPPPCGLLYLPDIDLPDTDPV